MILQGLFLIQYQYLTVIKKKGTAIHTIIDSVINKNSSCSHDKAIDKKSWSYK